MADKAPKTGKAQTGKVTTASIVLALITSLGGNGYFGMQSKDAQERLVKQRETTAVQAAAFSKMQETVNGLESDVATLRAATLQAKAEHSTKTAQLQALVKRFEDHLTAFVSTQSKVDVGLQGIRTELGALKTTLITIVTKL